VAGKRQPAHLAPRRPLIQAALPTGLGTTLSGGVSSLSRFGLAAVLGSALVTAGQMPASASGGSVAAAAAKSAPLTAAVPGAFTSGAPLGATPASSVTFDSAALTAVTAPKPATVKTAATAAAPKAASTTTLTAAARRAKIIKIAKQYVGVRYVWGGTKPRPGFDCSGYTKYVVKKAGKTLPRTSRQQYSHVRKIAKSQRKPGDLIFFKSSSGRVFHVGIYAGKGKMYDSPRPGKRVGLHTIWSSRVSYGRIA
jgi:cell wall-associated NlpC family hydrolase